MNERYRFEIHVKNARLYHAIIDRHGSVAEFCRMFGYHPVRVCDLMSLRISPFKGRKSGFGGPVVITPGIYKDFVSKLASDLGENVDDLFPFDLYQRGRLKKAIVIEKDLPQLPNRTTLLIESGYDDGLKDQVREVLSSLPKREEQVLKWYFGIDGDKKSIEEMEKLLDVTSTRIHQIIQKALRRLRHPNRSNKLRDFLE